MAISKEDILEGIGGMSVLDLSELIKAMEEKFGVSAAAVQQLQQQQRQMLEQQLKKRLNLIFI